MWKILVMICGSILAGFVALSLLAILILYFKQDGIIYRGVKNYEDRPCNYGMQYHDVWITAEDGVRLHAWLILQHVNSQRASTLIMLIGNGGNVGRLLDYTQEWYTRGFNVLLLSYRGFGESESVSTERGLKLDVAAAVKYVANRADIIDVKSIFVFGISLGGAVAISAAADPATGSLLRGVIIENSFTSMNDVLREMRAKSALLRWADRMKCMSILLWLNRNKWESVEAIQKISLPILFLSGLKDDFVPPHHMRLLYENASFAPHKEFIAFGEGSHDDTWKSAGEEYFTAVVAFVGKVLHDSRHETAVVDTSREFL